MPSATPAYKAPEESHSKRAGKKRVAPSTEGGTTELHQRDASWQWPAAHRQDRWTTDTWKDDSWEDSWDTLGDRAKQDKATKATKAGTRPDKDSLWSLKHTALC